MNAVALLPELERLVRETFSLWEQVRVGFSWRQYYFNHTIRVRNLALRLAEREGADASRVAVAATLHDLTKRYDGRVVTGPDGKRLLDENGFWRNEFLPPARVNEVTRLYDSLDMAGKLHNESGAVVAERLLRARGVTDREAAAVAEIIRAHVRAKGAPGDELCNRLECRVLYDADLIDANFGLVALFRNLIIHTHVQWERTGELSLEEYLDYLPMWIRRKGDLRGNLLTEPGREVAAARQRREDRWARVLATERREGDLAHRSGLLGVMDYLRDSHADPDLTSAVHDLETEWLPSRRRELAKAAGEKNRFSRLLAHAEEFVRLLHAEIVAEL